MYFVLIEIIVFVYVDHINQQAVTIWFIEFYFKLLLYHQSLTNYIFLNQIIYKFYDTLNILLKD